MIAVTDGEYMNTCNLISVYQGEEALQGLNLTKEQIKKFKTLKTHETRNVRSFCKIMLNCGCDIKSFDGYYVGYEIAQIGKEFDLLRFGKDEIINIEIKSELKKAKSDNLEKIITQMRKNYYYLKFLGKKIKIFTFVENDGFYRYDESNDELIKINEMMLCSCLKKQIIDYSSSPDELFVPSTYLVSPFNSTDKFMNDEYFLTSRQQEIKQDIIDKLDIDSSMCFALSANAGTGKTLLLYDIAKTFYSQKRKVGIIHCGNINNGQCELNSKFGWNIVSIGSIKEIYQINAFLEKLDILFIDEAQRLNTNQLDAVLLKAMCMKLPIVFAYDIKQYLRGNEGNDIYEYILQNCTDITIIKQTLTSKIRSNKNLASFITNLRQIGKSKDNLDYRCVTIEYFDNENDLSNYIEFLNRENWKSLTFTPSRYNTDPFDNIGKYGSSAHSVIGQEFSKVVFVMDENFKYDDNMLLISYSYYSAQGMLYQIITRVVDELKILVLRNPDLYLRLLEIKAMGA